MLKKMTRARVIQVWFAAVVLVFVAALAFGPEVTVGTGVMLLLLSIVPPVIAFFLWPAADAPTVGDVIRGTDRRS
jgi:hypothetical protein